MTARNLSGRTGLPGKAGPKLISTIGVTYDTITYMESKYTVDLLDQGCAQELAGVDGRG